MRRGNDESIEAGEIWIEPNDPEVSTLRADVVTEGFQHIGNGAAYFDSPRRVPIGILSSDISPTLLSGKDPTFLYVNGNKEFLLQIKKVHPIFTVFRLKEMPPQ